MDNPLLKQEEVTSSGLYWKDYVNGGRCYYRATECVAILTPNLGSELHREIISLEVGRIAAHKREKGL